MAEKYLVLWRVNLPAWPGEPKELAKLTQRMWANADELWEKGFFKDWGQFAQPGSGYSICEAESVEEVHENLSKSWPYVEYEVHGTVGYDKVKKLALSRFVSQE